MPTYNYECNKCQHQEDVICSMSEHTSTRPCTKCQGTSTQIITKCPAMHGLSTQVYGWRDIEKHMYGDVMEMGNGSS